MLKKLGFTLIELLVVISIIGLLASIVLVSLGSARMKARDTKRVEDLDRIRLALHLYFDANGFYPASACGWDCNGYSTSSNAANWAALGTALAQYMPVPPKDPINTAGGCNPFTPGCYNYSYGNVGRYTQRVQYDLTATLEAPNHPLSCGQKLYTYYFNSIQMCSNPIYNQLYEASPE